MELKDSQDAYHPITIDVEIVDKIIPRALIDDGSNVNIMSTSTMEKLGLLLTTSSYFSLRIADEASIKPIGHIESLRMQAGGEDYIVNFEVMSHKSTRGYPLLLGHGFLRKSGGVVNWMSNTPTFTYGPATNRTKIEFASKGPLFLDGGLPAIFTPSAICVEAVADLGSITCIGPGLYDYVDDGIFSQWLVDNPYDKNEPHVMFIKVQSNHNSWSQTIILLRMRISLSAIHLFIRKEVRTCGNALLLSTPILWVLFKPTLGLGLKHLRMISQFKRSSTSRLMALKGLIGRP